jgi:hypothetical protein
MLLVDRSFVSLVVKVVIKICHIVVGEIIWRPVEISLLLGLVKFQPLLYGIHCFAAVMLFLSINAYKNKVT